MTIEVRQMVIRSSVDAHRDAAPREDGERFAEAVERMKAEILAECRELLEEKLQESRER